MYLDEVLVKPIITEKSTVQRERGVYVFKVTSRANKILVRRAVENFFSVKVDKVRMVIQKPKKKVNFRTGRKSKSSILKKAYVYIEGNKKIPELDV